MQSGKWSAFAIGYQCLYAYLVSMMIYQFGNLFSGGRFTVWTAVAFGILAFLLFMLFRPGYKSTGVKAKAKVKG